jgi:hypothetical protein
MRVPLSHRRPGVAGVLPRTDGRYVTNWAPPDRPVPGLGVVYPFSPLLSVGCERVEEKRR